ncbi:chemokine (C-C motif) ligand 2, isoform CRA_a, partial [Mus musculus]
VTYPGPPWSKGFSLRTRDGPHILIVSHTLRSNGETKAKKAKAVLNSIVSMAAVQALSTPQAYLRKPAGEAGHFESPFSTCPPPLSSTQPLHVYQTELHLTVSFLFPQFCHQAQERGLC